MEFVRLFREMVMVLLVCKSSWTISVEPKYTKFMYEEQLLEKMVRLEMFVENMENDIKKLISDSMIAVNEIRNSTKSELNKMADRMDQFKSEMDSFHNDMTEWKDKTDTVLREYNNTLRDEDSKFDIEVQNGSEVVVFNVFSQVGQTRTQKEPVIFEHVVFNEGNCYDKSTGIFTAPVDGVYQFNAQLCVNKGLSLEYDILVESVNIVKGEYRVSSDSGDEKCTSFSAVSIVRKGEKVSVHGYNAALDASGDDPHSFSGALLKRL